LGRALSLDSGQRDPRYPLGRALSLDPGQRDPRYPLGNGSVVPKAGLDDADE
jgi:hypothetical protein